MIDLNVTGDNWNRDQRNGINENWQRIKNGLSNLQGQIKILAGGEEVDELLQRLNDAVESATIAVQESIDANNTATQDAITANNQALQIALNTIGTALTDVGNAIQAAETATNDAMDAKDAALQAAGDAQTTISQMQVIISNFRPRGEWNATTDYFKNNLAGLNGKTYIALQNNTNKPVTDTSFWMLFADRGAKGERGEKGEPGTGIKVLGHFNDVSELPSNPTLGDAYTIGADRDLYVYNGNDWQNLGSIKGVEGKSAYEVAVDNGFVGTEIEWLETLIGPPGPDGPPGPPADLTEINQKVDDLQTEVTEHLGQVNQDISEIRQGLDTVGKPNANGTVKINDNCAKRSFPIFKFNSPGVAEEVIFNMGNKSISGVMTITAAISGADFLFKGGCEIKVVCAKDKDNATFRGTFDILAMQQVIAQNFYFDGIRGNSVDKSGYFSIVKRSLNNDLFVELEFTTADGTAFSVLDEIVIERKVLSSPNNQPIQQSIFTHVTEKANKVQEPWINAVLQNGWANNSGPDTLKYFKDEFGILNISGVVYKETATASIITTLPLGYRPKRKITIWISDFNPTLRKIEINTNGEVAIIAPVSGFVVLDFNVFFATI